MKNKLFAVASSIAVVLAMFTSTPAHAAAVLAVPGSAIVGFATTTAVADPAAPLEFVNLDLDTHNVVAKAFGSDANPWCAKYGYAKGRCPIFRTNDVSGGGYADVGGVSALKSGVDYDFVCSIHATTMKGTLKVV